MQRNKVNINSPEFQISYGDKVAFLGSCFAENISAKMQSLGFDIDVNPLGVLFNPLSIAKLLLNEEEIINEKAFLRRDNIHLNWHANSGVYGFKTREDFRNEISNKLASFSNFLKSGNLLFISFGTAWVYEHIDSEQLVANCHKVPQSNFNKRLLETEEMYGEWCKVFQYLKVQNPNLKICLTVSPVRHVKDGLIENNRSKSRLFELVSRLEAEFNTEYFPAYEIVLDELRDYSFYKEDGVHPNQSAINYVWDKFLTTFFSAKTIKLSNELSKWLQFFKHKSLHPESFESKRQFDNQFDKLSHFLESNPKINIDINSLIKK